jgi:hypothetical protein
MRWTARSKRVFVYGIVGLLCLTFLVPSFTQDTIRGIQATISSGNRITNVHHGEGPWNIGDTWTYAVPEINIRSEAENYTFDVSLIIDNLIFEVADESEDAYRIECAGELNGHWNVFIEEYQLEISGQLAEIFPPKISGETIRRKSDLAIVDSELLLSGRAKLKLEENPLFSFPLPKLPLPFTINLAPLFEDPFILFDFPIIPDKTWSIPANHINLNGYIQSIWLNIANAINTLLLFFNIELIPEAIAQMLPIIDISSILAILGYEEGLQIPEIPFAFICLFQDEITVEAGTFDAYNILIFGEVGHMFYAPDIAKIIKVTIDTELISEILYALMELDITISPFEFELKDIA